MSSGDTPSQVSAASNRKQSLTRLAWLLDDSIPVPFLNRRIGLDSLIGLVPGLGDVAGALISSYILMQGVRLNAPKFTLIRMMLNIGVEVVVGWVPVLGDLFDMGWKANRRNVALLGDYLDQPQTTARSSALLVIGAFLGLLALGIGTAVLGFYVFSNVIGYLGTALGGLF